MKCTSSNNAQRQSWIRWHVLQALRRRQGQRSKQDLDHNVIWRFDLRSSEVNPVIDEMIHEGLIVRRPNQTVVLMQAGHEWLRNYETVGGLEADAHVNDQGEDENPEGWPAHELLEFDEYIARKMRDPKA